MAEPTDNFENLAMKPVVHWAIGRVGNSAVVLSLRYVDVPPGNEPKTGVGESIRLVLTPQQTRELVDSLTKAVSPMGEQS